MIHLCQHFFDVYLVGVTRNTRTPGPRSRIAASTSFDTWLFCHWAEGSLSGKPCHEMSQNHAALEISWNILKYLEISWNILKYCISKYLQLVHCQIAATNPTNPRSKNTTGTCKPRKLWACLHLEKCTNLRVRSTVWCKYYKWAVMMFWCYGYFRRKLKLVSQTAG